ncbi:SGNH/GDSL hydrolase family protein [Gordonia oryzae]|uniref:SGNH/GDSL hydrolase family protein n=1 Tax=Gordonia oryzae TaxID=2487349 RepID=A0A3N4GST9_9ACTN|nr:SGNH/GDSL hydrolase family protein [Gordonia oryzae]RPA62141.1 SGNH/GDSL hydrolase family protein [Gordonia oryzae]
MSRSAVGLIGAGLALSAVGAGVAHAGPLDGLSGVVAQLPGGSSHGELPGLDDFSGALNGLLGTAQPGSGTSRCTSVIQIGDSTSVAADNAAALPSAADTATSQYRRVGATTVTVDAVSGRAVVGGPALDAEHAVASRLAAGARGCWVIAMGVNDAGAIAGGGVGAAERIDRIMRQLQGQPVLWPTVTSSSPGNPAFGAASMAAVNTALRDATARYANLAVYDWAGAARADEFAGDGIHYTAAGTADRNRKFADALAAAYPPGTGFVPATRWVTG